MRKKILFYLLFISVATLYGQSDFLYDETLNLNKSNAYKNVLNENIFPKQLSGNNYYGISKYYYIINEKNYVIYAGFTRNFFDEETNILDSCVTFRTDKVLPDSWDHFYYKYNSDTKVKQILTFHFKGVRRSPKIFHSSPLTYYPGIIPLPIYSFPWVETIKFNSSGKVYQKLEISHVPESSYFIDNELFYYNENGELNKYTHLASNEDIVLEWDTIMVDTYMYSNPSKNSEITTILTWDTANLGWVNKKKNEINIDSMGQQILSIDSVWNTTTNTWQAYMKSETVYRAQNEILINTLYSYEPMRNRWIGQSKQEYIYYNNGEIKQVYYYLFDYFYESWYIDNICVYHFNITPRIPKITKVNLLTPSDIQVYPNPADDWLTIHLEQYFNSKYCIFNLHGQLVQSGELDKMHEKTINISSLNSGVYIVRIQIMDSEDNLFLKFVKR